MNEVPHADETVRYGEDFEMEKVTAPAAFVIACAALVAVFVFGSPRSEERVATPETDDERTVEMEKQLRRLRLRMDVLEAVIEEMDGPSLVGPPPEAPPARPIESAGADASGPSDAGASESPARPDGDAPPPSTVAELRKMIREEMEKERRRRSPRWRGGGASASKAEDWEKEEFGDYADFIHERGEELGLSDAQKRAYYSVVKPYYDGRERAWERARAELGEEASWREVRERFWKIREEQLKRTREEVLRILTPEQQDKYNEMFGGGRDRRRR